jgi:hypothetical protein
LPDERHERPFGKLTQSRVFFPQLSRIDLSE